MAEKKKTKKSDIDLWSSQYESIARSYDDELICIENVVSKILEKTKKGIELVEINNSLPTYTSEKIVTDMIDLMNYYFVQKDTQINTLPDPELAPTPLLEDSWSVGVVPIVKRKINKEVKHKEVISARKIVQNVQTKVNLINKMKKKDSTKEEKEEKKEQKHNLEKIKKTITVEEEKRETFRRETLKKIDQNQKKRTNPIRTVSKEIKDRKNFSSTTPLPSTTNASLNTSSPSNATSSSKKSRADSKKPSCSQSKEFTLDSSLPSSVILNKTDPDKFPLLHIYPKVLLEKTEEQDLKKPEKVIGHKISKKVKHIQTSALTDYQPTLHRPNIADSIELAPGVNYREGNNIKKGPSLSNNQYLSKTEYTRLLDTVSPFSLSQREIFQHSYPPPSLSTQFSKTIS